jgi:hypothetical protein
MNVKCPNCKSRMKVPIRAWYNADSYSDGVRVTTECCFKIVRIRPIRSYQVEIANGVDWGDGPVDDWDVPEGDAGRKAYSGAM